MLRLKMLLGSFIRRLRGLTQMRDSKDCYKVGRLQGYNGDESSQNRLAQNHS